MLQNVFNNISATARNLNYKFAWLFWIEYFFEKAVRAIFVHGHIQPLGSFTCVRKGNVKTISKYSKRRNNSMPMPLL